MEFLILKYGAIMIRTCDSIDIGTVVRFYGTDLKIVEVNSDGIILENEVFIPHHLVCANMDDSANDGSLYYGV
jgi:hypothetical protein